MMHFVEHRQCAASHMKTTATRTGESREDRCISSKKSTRSKQEKGANVHTVLVGDLDVQEEELEALGVGADELGERPVEGGTAADGGVRVPPERRLIHRHHHPRRR
jgi:hypothetical protein